MYKHVLFERTYEINTCLNVAAPPSLTLLHMSICDTGFLPSAELPRLPGWRGGRLLHSPLVSGLPASVFRQHLQFLLSQCRTQILQYHFCKRKILNVNIIIFSQL